MGFFSTYMKAPSGSVLQDKTMGLISNGRNKKTGGHDHRTNRGDDRTPAQKMGDKKPNMKKN